MINGDTSVTISISMDKWGYVDKWGVNGDTCKWGYGVNGDTSVTISISMV